MKDETGMDDETGSGFDEGTSRRDLFRMVLGGSMAGMVAGMAALGGTESQAAVGVAQPGGANPARFQKGMQVIITGSGSALPDPERGGASAAVVVDGHILQFDCGRRFMDNLMLAGASPLDIDAVCLTHLHFDHITLYPYYYIAAWIAGRQGMVQVRGPHGTEAMNAGQLQMNDMNLRFVDDILDYWPENMTLRPTAKPPYEVADTGPGVVLENDLYKVTAVPTDHLPDPTMKSLAYKVESKYGAVVISGDTRPVQSVIDLAKGVDILIHECQKPDPGMIKGGKMESSAFQHPTQSHPQTGHTSPTQLGEIAKAANPKLLVATHLPPYTSVEQAVNMSKMYTGSAPGFQIWGDYIAAIRKNFSGPVVLAEDAMVFEVGQSA